MSPPGPPYIRSEVAPLREALLTPPREAFPDGGVAPGRWTGLGWLAAPEIEAAVAEHGAFVRLLEGAGVRISYLSATTATGPDLLYARDASVVAGAGALLCRTGKAARRAEAEAHEAALRALGIPILGGSEDAGCVEGGDVVWLDDRTVAVGRGYRTDDAGIRRLRELLGDGVDEVIVVPLPHWRGPGDVFHLMSVLSPIDEDLLLVYSPLLPVPFRETLVARGFELVEVPDEEFETMGANVLALGPRRCVMLEGNPRSRSRLEAAGAEVATFRGEEICRKGRGGPTCLVRPLRRG